MKPLILLLDDNKDNLLLLETLLKGLPGTGGAETASFTDASEALEWCQQHQPDVCLVDYMMPGMDGIEFIVRARQLPNYDHIPMIMITGVADKDLRIRALDNGATDFMLKPVHPKELRLRIINLLVLRQNLLNPEEQINRIIKKLETAVKNNEPEEIIGTLSRIGKLEQEETASHMRRVAHISRLIAEELGHDQSFCHTLFMAAPMHDIGKIGVPGHLLLKPGKLDNHEWEIMKSHTSIGHELLKNSSVTVLNMAAEIAYSHHEHYDGKGYPRNLKGDAIPIAARITAVADELDNLLATRPYKKPCSDKEAFATIKKESGGHFDPACVQAITNRKDDIMGIQKKYSD